MHSRVQYWPKPTKYRPSRPNDYIYDPNFVVASPKDFQRCVLQAAKDQAEFKPQPNFPSMFSDSPRYPCMRWSLKHVDRVPPHIDKTYAAKQMSFLTRPHDKVDVTGVHRHFFFGSVMEPKTSPETSSMLTEQHDSAKNQAQQEYALTNCNRSIQTEFRDSEAQTVPWAPPYFTSGEGSSPEILSLAMLAWENGLPAGMHEVEIIERLRIKRAWERVVPPMDNPENIRKRKDILEAIERDEWSFREKEIQTIHEMRLDLAQQLLNHNQNVFSNKMTERLERLRKLKEKEKEDRIEKINIKTNRELRLTALPFLAL